MAKGLAVAMVAAASGAVIRRAMRARRVRGPSDLRDGADGARWHVVTVNRKPEEVSSAGQLPEPLAELGDQVEVQIRPAPGDRGTEIAVRLREGEPTGAGALAARLTGSDPRYAIRAALRRSRHLIETGEVLSPHQPATTRRSLRNRPLQQLTARGREEGLL